jgi:glycosyltransferase involved in cell wall biosynthesis
MLGEQINNPKRQAQSVSVLSLFSHALYSDKPKTMGGAERRAYYWLRLLQESGFSVSAVLAHQESIAKDFKSRLSAPWPLYEHPKYQISGKVVVANLPPRGFYGKVRDKFLSLLGMPLPSTFKKNHFLKNGVYAQINADIYLAFGLTNAANELGHFCKEGSQVFLVSIAGANDFDFILEQSGKDLYDNKRSLKKETLFLADAVVAQTRQQEEMLKELGIPLNKIYRINNPIEVLSLNKQVEPSYFLWVGRLDANKNAEAFLVLAQRCPELKFMMVISQTMDKEIEHHWPYNLNNLAVISSVSPMNMRAIYQNAYCLVSTSFNEGFPNTFLEAWESAVPVASLHVNPDELLTSNQLGYFSSGSLEELEMFLREMERNPKKRNELGSRGRNYVEEHHELSLVASKITTLFQSLIS